MKRVSTILLLFVFILISCSKEKGCTDPDAVNYNPDAEKDDGNCVFDNDKHNPTPYEFDIPFKFPSIDQPAENMATVEGVKLGKMLYYDPALHKDSSHSCASCHNIQYGFTTPGTNVMHHSNLAWATAFLWDGRTGHTTLEGINYFEVKDFFETDLQRLQNHPDYPELFKKAFGTDEITYELAAFALSQFMRTQITGNSNFDKWLKDEYVMTESEMRGWIIFNSEPRLLTGDLQGGGDCFHCHGTILLTTGIFHNIGLDSVFDINNYGLANLTGNNADIGKFKAPSLRNVELRKGYMHDARFKTLEEVIEFYNTGGLASEYIDPLMKTSGRDGLQLTEQEKSDLIEFLKTLTDHTFINNPELKTPF